VGGVPPAALPTRQALAAIMEITESNILSLFHVPAKGADVNAEYRKTHGKVVFISVKLVS
jgi:hypothetical protein